MHRIQFDISDEELKRMLPFILKEKNRHVFAEKALSEWINRQEGRNRRRLKNDRQNGKDRRFRGWRNGDK